MLKQLIRWRLRKRLRAQFKADIDKLRPKAKSIGVFINAKLEIECSTCHHENCGQCSIGRRVAELKEEISRLRDIFEHQCRYL